MTMYKDIVSINKNFQASINLEFDLNNERKIDEYIPTSDICDVLKRYFRSFLGFTNEKATTLVGPYGKGKSFLLLVLSYLISKDKKKTPSYKSLMTRIKAIDKELYELISEFDKRKLKILPVLVNSNYDNVQQSFMLALNEALNRAGKQDVIPNTIYSVCLNLLNEWNKTKNTREALNTCIKNEGTTYKELKSGLSDYSPKAYRDFENIYNCMTIGIKFNPLISDDVAKLYSDVNYELTKSGYTGMFIIFDEFSKFIESAGSSLMKDLKIIQDFAELASRSSNSCQLHLACVTHKSLNLYSDGTNKKDSFKTVEGRFTEIKFNRSLEENYQIISAAIRKKDGFEKAFAKWAKDQTNNAFAMRVRNTVPFEGTDDFDELLKGCFPLNPLTVYSLIQLSEIVAQNERTLFTFISDTDDHSLNSFIQRKAIADGLFDVDEIYDYFSPLLKKEETNSIRNIWFRAEGTLSRLDDRNQRRVIKALAVILMINDFDRLSPSYENLSLSLRLQEDVIKTEVENLIASHYLRRNAINNHVTFASTNSREIEDQIKVVTKTRGSSLPIEMIAEEVDETKYYLPRRHNEQKKITRFFRSVYLTEEQFMAMSSFDIFYERLFCDGLVINIIRRKLSKNEIRRKVEDIGDSRTIVRFPSEPLDAFFVDELIRYAAIQEIIRRGGNDDVITGELNILFDEIKEDIQVLIEKYFGEDSSFVCAASINSKCGFKNALSELMDRYYCKTPVFNNELINKNTVTTQYQKPVNNVIKWILDGMNEADFGFTETSPESTVRASVVSKIDRDSKELDHNAREIVDGIKEFIFQSGKRKASLDTLVETYTGAPFGVRRGILPILLAKAIGELSDNVILYIQNQELDLNPANISKAIYNPGKYFISFSKGSKEQSDYLYKMLQIFRADVVGNFRIDTRTLCEEYRKFFVGLPAIMRSNDNLSAFMNIDENVLSYRNLFFAYNINPYELVYEKPQDIFGTSNYKKLTEKISDFIQNWETYLTEYKQGLVNLVKDEFNIKKLTSLKMGLTDYVRKVTDDNTPMLNEEAGRIYNTINMIGFDDFNACDDLAYAALGVYIEDWSRDETEAFSEKLNSFKNTLSQANRIDTKTTSLDQVLNNISNVETTPMGKLMRNSIESVFDEYGEGVSSEEKLAILGEMMKNLL